MFATATATAPILSAPTTVRRSRSAGPDHRSWLLLASVLLLMCLRLSASAALVDVDFNAIRGTEISELLIAALRPASGTTFATTDPNPAAVPADVTAGPIFNPTGGLQRVLITWSSVKSPPVITFIGLRTPLIIKTLSAGAPPTTTPVGPAWLLPNVPGFYFAVVSPAELVVSTLPGLLAQTPGSVQAASGHALEFTGVSTDLKLGDLQAQLKDFTMTYDTSGATRIVIRAKSEEDARHVDRWVWWRKPLVFAGADLGVKKLQFPAKLLDQTTMTRDKDQLIATTTLQNDMKTQAFNVLANAIRKQLRNFQPPTPPTPPAPAAK
jgi:hypothetical protein